MREELGFTVAVKHKNEPVKLCGFYASRAEASRNAKSLRQSWLGSILQSPTSIRVRQVYYSKWVKEG